MGWGRIEWDGMRLGGVWYGEVGCDGVRWGVVWG